MAFIDVLKYRGPENALVWKWEPEESRWGFRRDTLRLGTQLVVNPSFIAVFVKEGQIADIFAPGTYTLSSKNLPFLGKIMAVPFGNRSPFTAEVYYINKAVILGTQFEIPPFNMSDPNFRVPIPLTCTGSFGVRVGEARLFLTKLFGSLEVITPERIKEYFNGVIIENVKTTIAKVAKSMGLGPMDLEAAVGDVSESIFSVIATTMSKYGVRLDMLNIESIAVVDDEPRVKKVIEEYHRIMSEDLEERMRLKRRGENIDVYRVERTFDTTEAAANSIGQGGGDGGVMGAVVGLGIAQPMAGAMANVMQGALVQPSLGQRPNISMPQQIQQTVVQSREDILKTIRDLDTLRKEGALTEEEFAAKKQELLSKI